MKQTLDFLQSLVFVAFFLAGLAGLSFHLLRDEGWLEEMFGTTWDFTIRYPLIAVPLILGAIIVGKLWRDDRVAHGKHSSKAGSIVLYVIVGAGLYYTAHYLVHGTI